MNIGAEQLMDAPSSNEDESRQIDMKHQLHQNQNAE
jgi:hypothetical protein